MRPGLETAIDGLYRAFSVRAPKHIDACPCCRDPKDYKQLPAKALNTLTSEALGNYTASVMYTVGSAEDFRYFLPRIFELAAREPYAYPEIEIRLKKLEVAGWRSWAAKEQKAVETFLSEWFEQLLEAAPPEGHVIDGFICGAGLAGCDLGPFLTRLAAHPDALLEVYDSNAAMLMKKRKVSNAFWGASPVAAQYAEWLLSPEVQGKLGYA